MYILMCVYVNMTLITPITLTTLSLNSARSGPHLDLEVLKAREVAMAKLEARKKALADRLEVTLITLITLIYINLYIFLF